MGNRRDCNHKQASCQTAQPHRAMAARQQQNQQISEQNRRQVKAHRPCQSAQQAFYAGKDEALKAQTGKKGQHRQKEASPCQYLPDGDFGRLPLHSPLGGGVGLFLLRPGAGRRFLLCHVDSLLNRSDII